MGNWSPPEVGRNRIMGITLKMRREMVQVERDVMKGLREDLRVIRAAMNQSRLNIKMHQEVLADERKFKRIVMMEQRTLRAAKRNEKRFAKIAAMEAKLAALKAAA